MDGPEIESRWDKIFLAGPHRLRDLPTLLYKEYQVFSECTEAGVWC
jgi:hypothetical protein